MSTLTHAPLAVGSTVRMAGYFTKRHTLGDPGDGSELERRLGFAPGSLLMVVRTPAADEFELGGYTHFSGGHIRGHKTPKGEHVEDALRSISVDVQRTREALAARFTISGPQRLAKIVPVIRPHSWWHPDPNPVPQWKLTREMEFLVSAQYPGSRSSA